MRPNESASQLLSLVWLYRFISELKNLLKPTQLKEFVFNVNKVYNVKICMELFYCNYLLLKRDGLGRKNTIRLKEFYFMSEKDKQFTLFQNYVLREGGGGEVRAVGKKLILFKVSSYIIESR